MYFLMIFSFVFYVRRFIIWQMIKANVFFAVTVEDLIELLQFECNVAIEWFVVKKMFVNLYKFQAILLDKQESDYTGTKQIVSSEEI